MPLVYLGLGSNVEPKKNLQLGIGELQEQYGELEMSAVYQNAAVGFDGADFLNIVVGLRSDDAPRDIQREVGLIHDLAGRDRASDRFSSRPLDIDLLLYDRLVDNCPPVRVPRNDVLEYSFVLVPLAELAADYVHPISGRRISDHRLELDENDHPLTKKDLDL